MPDTDYDRASLAVARYVSLATYRRDGREIQTPVWFVELDHAYYCFSAGDAGKVKRVRNNGRARIAPCDIRGTVNGPWYPAEAQIVGDAALIAAVYRALRSKYGWQMWLADLGARLSGRLTRRAVLRIALI